jgi:hypothetical protein
MSLFQPIVDTLPAQSGITLGSTVRFVLPRDFAYEGFMIVARPTVSGAAATIAAEGIFSLIKRVRLTANDGGQNRDLVNADGLSIVQRHLAYNTALDTETCIHYNNAFGSTTAKVIRIPHFFCPNEIEDPARSLFLANFPRFNNDPILEIQIGVQADVDKHATPTFAISAMTIEVVCFKRFVTSDKWNFLKTDFITQEQTYTVDAAMQRYSIPIPGWHFAIGMRAYSAASTLGDISQTGGLFRVQALNVVERVISWVNALATNQFSAKGAVPTTANDMLRGIVQSSVWFDYMTDLSGAPVTNLDTLLNSNPYVALGASPQIVADIVGGTGKKIVFMHDRAYGDVSPALYLPKIIGRAA